MFYFCYYRYLFLKKLLSLLLLLLLLIFLIKNDFLKHKQANINVKSRRFGIIMTPKRCLLTLIFASLLLLLIILIKLLERASQHLIWRPLSHPLALFWSINIALHVNFFWFFMFACVFILVCIFFWLFWLYTFFPDMDFFVRIFSATPSLF